MAESNVGTNNHCLKTIRVTNERTYTSLSHSVLSIKINPIEFFQKSKQILYRNAITMENDDMIEQLFTLAAFDDC